MLENYKDIPGYEGLYQASTEGRIWSIRSQRYMKPRFDRYGYQRINLTAKNGKVKTELVHRVVCMAFHGKPPEGRTVVDHIDGNINNNSADNLQWVSISENTKKAYVNNESGYQDRAKVKGQWEARSVYCEELGQIFHSLMEAERQTGVNCSSISSCCRGMKKTAGGLHWSYFV